jgi:hypothetical protein
MIDGGRRAREAGAFCRKLKKIEKALIWRVSLLKRQTFF